MTRFEKIFNTLARFTGGCFIVGGLILVISTLKSRDRIGLAMSAIAVILGILILKAKPYISN